MTVGVPEVTVMATGKHFVNILDFFTKFEREKNNNKFMRSLPKHQRISLAQYQRFSGIRSKLNYSIKNVSDSSDGGLYRFPTRLCRLLIAVVCVDINEQ